MWSQQFCFDAEKWIFFQELKGNIRVFCRVRPISPDNDSSGTDGAVVYYPTSTESLGRGIDLIHNSTYMLFFAFACLDTI